MYWREEKVNAFFIKMFWKLPLLFQPVGGYEPGFDSVIKNQGLFIMTKTLQHYLNPLHVYCRLKDLGLAERPAIFLCRLYERAVFNYLLVRRW